MALRNQDGQMDMDAIFQKTLDSNPFEAVKEAYEYLKGLPTQEEKPDWEIELDTRYLKLGVAEEGLKQQIAYFENQAALYNQSSKEEFKYLGESLNEELTELQKQIKIPGGRWNPHQSLL